MSEKNIYINFYDKEMWNTFYKDKVNDEADFYFDLRKTNCNFFNLEEINENKALLIIGPGTSTIVEYLNKKNFEYLDLLDFSEVVIELLKKRYADKNSGWSFIKADISKKEDIDIILKGDDDNKDSIKQKSKENEDNEISNSEGEDNENDSNEGPYDIIIDKACIDCILTDPYDAEFKFQNALKNILSLLNSEGKFYYFTVGKIKDRINLINTIDNIKVQCEPIVIKDDSTERFFNEEDNIYNLFVISKKKENNIDEEEKKNNSDSKNDD